MKKILLAAVFAAAAVSAAPVCQLGTLADYIALGSTGCMINDKIFANFQSLHTATGGASAATDATIAVSPIVQAGPAILNPGPGLVFSTGDWTAFAGQTVNTSIRFTVTTTVANYFLKDASLAFSGAATGATGAATITETILTSAGGFGMFVGDVPGSGSDVFQDDVVYPATKSITVLKDIQVKAGAGSFAKISFVQQQFSQIDTTIPEPASMALVGGALLLVGLLRRR